MKVVSVNIADIQSIKWRGKEVKTGIYKKPVAGSVRIDETGVSGDQVVDRKYHGSPEMAAYIYSADWYDYWKKKYPDLEWTHGMFGENLTVKGLNEKELCYGDLLHIGKNLKLQVAQPRQPCFKLGVKFGTQKIIKDFITAPYPGIYVRVLNPGIVSPGDAVTIKSVENGLPVLKVWEAMFNSDRSDKEVEMILDDPYLSDESKASIRKKVG